MRNQPGSENAKSNPTTNRESVSARAISHDQRFPLSM
jgi:hypothetical protein